MSLRRLTKLWDDSLREGEGCNLLVIWYGKGMVDRMGGQLTLGFSTSIRGRIQVYPYG